MQEKYDCPVFCAGDLYDHWKPSPYLLSTTLANLPKKFFTVLGNHDLPQHSMELYEKCGVNVLAISKNLNVLSECNWGQTPNKGSLFIPSINKSILIWHVMTYQGKSPWPGCTAPTAFELLNKYPQFPLLLIGDNHKSFVEELDGRILVNPGSLTRQTADQEEHRPCVWLWYADTNTVTPHYMQCEKNVISREHIDKIDARNERLDAFVQTLSNEWDEGISFEENLERFFRVNSVRESVIKIIRKAITP